MATIPQRSKKGLEADRIKAYFRVVQNPSKTTRTRFQPVSWSAFLEAYKSVWYCDFTIVFDAKGSQIFIFNIIDGATRQLVLSNATLNPTRIWVIQQVRNCEINGFMLPKALVHDRDAIFGKYFDRLLREEFGVEPIVTDFKSPWQNGKIGTPG